MRYFQIFSVTKPGQGNQKTKSMPNKLFSGTPSQAARKAMTALCDNKKIRGVCTLTIAMREVKRVMRDGEYTVIPVLDSDNMEIIRKYKIKRVLNENADTPVVFEGTTPVAFRYKTDVVESFGRVSP
jgi:hypothetical protein